MHKKFIQISYFYLFSIVKPVIDFWNVFLDCIAVTRLQCLINVGDGFRYNDLSLGIHVSNNPIITHLYERCRTTTSESYTFCDWDTSILSSVQEEFQNAWRHLACGFG